MSYKHCIEGVRPDVSLRAYDDLALVTCDRNDGPLDEVAKERPVYALLVQDEGLAANTNLTPVPVAQVKLPWGQRYPQYTRPLYRLDPIAPTP